MNPSSWWAAFLMCVVVIDNSRYQLFADSCNFTVTKRRRSGNFKKHTHIKTANRFQHPEKTPMANYPERKCSPRITTIDLFGTMRRIRLKPTKESPIACQGKNMFNPNLPNTACEYYGDVIGEPDNSVFGQFYNNKFYGLIFYDGELYAIDASRVEHNQDRRQNIYSILNKLGFISNEDYRHNRLFGLRNTRSKFEGNRTNHKLLNRLGWPTVGDNEMNPDMSYLISADSIKTIINKEVQRTTAITVTSTPITTSSTSSPTTTNTPSTPTTTSTPSTPNTVSTPATTAITTSFSTSAATNVTTSRSESGNWSMKAVVIDGVSAIVINPPNPSPEKYDGAIGDLGAIKPDRLSPARDMLNHHTYDCSLTLIADHTFFEEVGKGNLQISEGLLTNLVREVDRIFRSTNFKKNGEPSLIGFHVENVIVHSNPLDGKYPPYLQGESTRQIRAYDAMVQAWGSAAEFTCYGIFFTCRNFADDFDGPVGRICQPAKSNLGLVNLNCENKVVNRAMSALMLARTLGRAFGAEYDNKSSSCFSVNTSLPHQNETFIMSMPFYDRPEGIPIQFSTCSVNAINSGIDKHGSCLRHFACSIPEDYAYYSISLGIKFDIDVTVPTITFISLFTLLSLHC